MFVFDRLYGKLTFPPLIQRLLRCPGLLRLREVRMANIPFLSFPAFAATTRYEHSLGVCHLAGVFAEHAGLSEKDKIEVMLAALYHDVATPPFAHAVEEVLANLYDFDHEDKLRRLITGETDDLGKQRTQLFLGHSLRLHSVCQTKEARRIGIDIFRIADLAAGSENDPLGDIICSNDIDLDNVDNVFRAATAMGVYHPSQQVAENLARCFVFDGSRVCLDEGGIAYVEEWQCVREVLYGMIYASIQDFAQQTMLKHALQHLARSSTDYKLREADWCLTDDELIHQRLLCEPASAEIVKRMRLGNVYTCLTFLSVEGHNCVREITTQLGQIEQTAMECFRDFFERKKGQRRKHGARKPSVMVPEVVANVYPDKRHRLIKRPVVFMGHERYLEEKTSPISKVLLGIFTPFHRKWDVTARKIFIERLQESFQNLRITDAYITGGQHPNVDGGQAE
jgi:HD superfamily phosphohydrolase